MEIDPRQLEALTSQLRVTFIDGTPRQTVQVEGFAPVYFPNTRRRRRSGRRRLRCA